LTTDATPDSARGDVRTSADPDPVTRLVAEWREALEKIAGLTWYPGDVHGGWEAAHKAIRIAHAALESPQRGRGPSAEAAAPLPSGDRRSLTTRQRQRGEAPRDPRDVQRSVVVVALPGAWPAGVRLVTSAGGSTPEARTVAPPGEDSEGGER